VRQFLGGPPSVRDLQSRAQREIGRRRRLSPPSRAARLFLIEQLSRRSGQGLALLGGMVAALAVLVGLGAPGRAFVWAGMTAPALYVCRRLLSAYRVGEAAGRRPFHWRADYVAALTVLGASFGSGAMLLVPASAGFAASAAVAASVVTAALVAALAHAASRGAAAALFGPAAGFAVLAGLRPGADGLSSFMAVAIASLGVGLIAYAGRRARSAALERFPAGGRSAGDADESAAAGEAEAAALGA